MNCISLPNKLTLIYEQRKSESIALNLSVHTGSHDEHPSQNGIAHFVEHMVFEGTTTRSAHELSQAIESKGGSINAGTSTERTAFFIKILKNHLPLALDILSDIAFSPVFTPHLIEKERNVIRQEINMFHDDPRFHRWFLFQQNLFQSSLSLPISGSPTIINALKRDDLVAFHKKHYVPNNMVLSIAGNGGSFSSIKKQVERYFSAPKPQPLPRMKVMEPRRTKAKVVTEFRKTRQAYMVIGCKTSKRMEQESLVFDIIDAVLARGQSGTFFDILRNKHGIAYELGIHHDPALRYGLFAAYVSTAPHQLKKAQSLMLAEMRRMGYLASEELAAAKTYIEGSFMLEQDDTQERADNLSDWYLLSSSTKRLQTYVKDIKAIPLPLVRNCAKKYLQGPFCTIRILPK